MKSPKPKKSAAYRTSGNQQREATAMKRADNCKVCDRLEREITRPTARWPMSTNEKSSHAEPPCQKEENAQQHFAELYVYVFNRG
jgi:hypothetical protein